MLFKCGVCLSLSARIEERNRYGEYACCQKCSHGATFEMMRFGYREAFATLSHLFKSLSRNASRVYHWVR